MPGVAAPAHSLPPSRSGTGWWGEIM
ncbi:hypothetical protein E2C01_000908 [Portunus trituberculatus]|uniref:Uncharacterized protein n=1 Tax=Portunus trituberculatus TaxID=210409 RepID=A0A5B7CIW0_PORTR|nr:hypothetical protein [Portunus trituberculatus]